MSANVSSEARLFASRLNAIMTSIDHMEEGKWYRVPTEASCGLPIRVKIHDVYMYAEMCDECKKVNQQLDQLLPYIDAQYSIQLMETGEVLEIKRLAPHMIAEHDLDYASDKKMKKLAETFKHALLDLNTSIS